jgi:hypothetical protein
MASFPPRGKAGAAAAVVVGVLACGSSDVSLWRNSESTTRADHAVVLGGVADEVWTWCDPPRSLTVRVEGGSASLRREVGEHLLAELAGARCLTASADDGLPRDLTLVVTLGPTPWTWTPAFASGVVEAKYAMSPDPAGPSPSASAR